MQTAIATPPGYRPGEAGYRRLSVALFAAGLATFAMLYSTQPLLPELVTAFDISPSQSAFSVSFATLGLGIALLIAGPASERLGRTKLMRWSVAAAAVIAVLCTVAPTWHVLLALRGVQGIALAGLPAVAMAYLREEVHEDSHARASGLYIAGTALGGMTGRLIGGGLADLGGWRTALGGIAVLGLVCAALVAFLLPSSRNFSPSPTRRNRAVLTDPGLLALYGISAAAMGAFVAVYNATGFRLAAAPYDLGPGPAGLVFTVYVVGSAASAIAGRLADRYGRRAVVPIGCLITMGGVAITLASPLPLVVAGLAVMTAGFFAVHGVASGWVAVRAHAVGGGTAQAASLYLFAYYLGSSVFGGLAGTAWSHSAWPGVAVEAGVLFGVTLVLALALRRVPSRNAKLAG
ncbi:YNFM family putative membrane transporter [Kribbella amoyensis]|uniref:YNFM family putative membrane transporter n=1 Tax=Kribbella amoyensis TaxID=996641 RepID=A0A561BQI9_9ACTN|nr:MFS transporter [Kribbella amoyensis]TWD81104.1 YNFM family putative membrane transporter [Kribbella amoyensis]